MKVFMMMDEDDIHLLTAMCRSVIAGQPEGSEPRSVAAKLLGKVEDALQVAIEVNREGGRHEPRTQGQG